MKLSSVCQKYDLNLKVDRFIEEHAKKIKGRYTEIGEFGIPRNLRDYIEAKAVFAELRHPFAYTGGMDSEKAEAKNDSARRFMSWKRFDSTYWKIALTEEEEVNEMVLFRIMERGGHADGLIRGFGFANEMELDVNFVIQYGVDSAYFPREFIEQSQDKLNLDMMCPQRYWFRTSGSDREVCEEPLRDILQKMSFDVKEHVKVSIS
jgi:hypothetical protein